MPAPLSDRAASAAFRRDFFVMNLVMKTSVALLAVGMLTLAANSAEAKGCIKGAVVGGVAGHYAGHHGLLGAAAGCLYGRHEAHKHAQQQQQGSGQPPADPNKL
jgi:hypothetical protein